MISLFSWLVLAAGLVLTLLMPRRLAGARLFLLLMLLCGSAAVLHGGLGLLAIGGGVQLATVTVALVDGPGSTGYPSQNFQEWTVIATADADTTTGAVTHALGGAYAMGTLIPVGSTAGLSLWYFSTYPATTTWAATKTTTSGSGASGVQLRVRLQRAI
jgi:hypothetical protein